MNIIVDILVTCFEECLLLYLLNNEKIKRKKSKQLILFIFMAVSMVIMTNLSVNIFTKQSIGILLIVIIGRFVYECSFVKLLLYAILYYFAISVGDMIVIDFWNFYFNTSVYSENIIIDDFILSLILTAKALNFFIIIIVKKITNRDKNNKSLKDIIPIVSVGIPFIIVLECLCINKPIKQDEGDEVLFIISSVIVFIAFIYILIFFEKNLQIQKKAQEEKALLQEAQLKHSYYERRREDEERVKKIYHDLKNHFLLVKSDVSMKNILEEIKEYENYIDTGNEFLDIIINEKIRVSKQKSINMECNIDFRETEFIQSLDISTIFGNILDNAIEATEKLNEEERYIFINVEKKDGLYMIAVKNSRLLTHKKNTNTSKSNSSFHGYGLKSVSGAVKKYDGVYHVKSDDTEFAINLIIPIPEKRG